MEKPKLMPMSETPEKPVKVYDIILRSVQPYGWLPIIRQHVGYDGGEAITEEVYRGEYHMFPESALETAKRAAERRNLDDQSPV